MTRINWLTQFKEIISVYSDNHTNPINTFCGHNAEFVNAKHGGAYNYHWALKVNM
jgi:hypothetical protein